VPGDRAHIALHPDRKLQGLSPHAKERGFRDQHISPCAVTLINPYAEREAGLVQLYWDAEEAADVLAFKRKKWVGK
jgi:hypothetical protein